MNFSYQQQIIRQSYNQLNFTRQNLYHQQKLQDDKTVKRYISPLNMNYKEIQNLNKKSFINNKENCCLCM